MDAGKSFPKLWSATACRRFVIALLPQSPAVPKRRQAVALQRLPRSLNRLTMRASNSILTKRKILICQQKTGLTLRYISSETTACLWLRARLCKSNIFSQEENDWTFSKAVCSRLPKNISGNSKRGLPSRTTITSLPEATATQKISRCFSITCMVKLRAC